MKIKKEQIAITLGIMCFLLVFGIGIQLRTTQNLISTAGNSTYKENKLRDEVLRVKEQYDSTYEELEKTESELDKERQESTSSDDSSVEKQEELKTINTYLGLTDVEGSGIIVTLKDNTTTMSGVSDDIVHDSDLRAVVNELKNSGAEAISINGQRIVSSTAITCAGTVIKVNNETVGSPFVIKAIGKQQMMSSITRSGGYIYNMKRDGVSVDVKESDDITIEKYNGVLTHKYIKTVE